MHFGGIHFFCRTVLLDFVTFRRCFMILRGKTHSFYLTTAALVFWLCSLPLICISTYVEKYQILGFQILAMGWLGPLTGVFAWYANIFFLFAVWRLFSGRLVAFSPVLAVLISLDTFRFDRYVLDEGGGSVAVYGYGWGAALWFLALFVLLIAAGARSRELPNKGSEEKWLSWLGVALCFVLIVGISYFYFNDRRRANLAELQKLEGLVFKRTSVCQELDPEVLNPMQELSGPLEVQTGKNNRLSINDVRNYVQWGIETVRVNGLDYSAIATPHGKVIVSKTASGPSAALLRLRETTPLEPWRTIISADLTEVGTGRQVFSQKWQREIPGSYYYCPDYHNYPSEDEQPRKLFVQSLGLSKEDSFREEDFYRRSIYEIVDAEIVSYGEGGLTRREIIEGWKKRNPDHKGVVPYRKLTNRNCPVGVGFGTLGRGPMDSIGSPLQVKDKAYYLRGSGYRATCEDQSIYLYSEGSYSSYHKECRLNIEKRTLPDLQPVWGRIVKVSNVDSSLCSRALEIQSATTVSGGVSLELVHNETGQIVRVKIPINGSPYPKK